MSTEDHEGHKQALPGGFRLGSYEVVRVLGAGGFGITYLCEHAGLGVQVAVKEYLPNEIAVRDGTAVHPKSAGDREGFEWGLSRFLDEARTLARFEHPNVVQVRDCFEANSTAYIVMDYEDGEPLDALLERRGTLTEAQLKRVVVPVADGLRQVHAAGFLHRDVKPSNIFVRRSDESPVLLDFGSARQALGRRSRSMTAIASAGYSPPEQYESRGDQGAWTDIYALSALCHRAIMGRAPVEAPRRTGEVARSRADPHIGLVDADLAGYSSGLLEAVDCGLHLIETERPQSLDDWLARVERKTTPVVAGPRADTSQPAAQSSTGDQSGRREADSRRRMVDLWGLVCLGVLLGSGIGVGITSVVFFINEFDTTSRGLGRSAIERDAAWYRKAAEQGYASAQYNLGVLYENGDGVPKDAAEAALWYRKAAEQGYASAQYNLGVLYENGDGVPKDAAEAALWYRKAAEQGLAIAQNNLGVLYQNGLGVPKDAAEAALWYRKAAEQGLASAQYNLGFLLSVDEGIPIDYVQAYAWFNLAAAQGIEDAASARAAVRRELRQPHQLAEAQKLSRELVD